MDGANQAPSTDFEVIAKLDVEIERLRARLARHERALSSAEDQDRHLSIAKEAARIGHYSYDLETDELFWSDEIYRIMGMEPGTPVTMSGTLDIFHPDDRDKAVEATRNAIKARRGTTAEYRIVRPDGEVRLAFVSTSVSVGDDRRVRRLFGVVQDITERRTADEALRASEKRFRGLFELAGVGTLISIPGQSIVAVNPAICGMFGYSEEEMLGMSIRDLQHPDDLAENDGERELMKRGVAPSPLVEKRYRRKDGSTLWAALSRVVIWKDDGSLDYIIGHMQDVTERKKAERALAESEQRFKDFAHTAADRLWELDADLRFTMVLSGNEDRSVAEIESMIGRHPWEVTGATLDEPNWRRQHERMQAREPYRDYRYTRYDASGRLRHMRSSGTPIFDPDGNFKGYRGTSVDETEEIEARETAQRTQRRFADAIENMPENVTYWDADGRFVMANSQFRRNNNGVNELLVPGITFEDFIGRRVTSGSRLTDDPDVSDEQMVADIVEKFRSGHAEFEFIRDGRWQNNRVRRLKDGSTLIFRSDVTDAKLREEELRQALKMDAVGKLTAGIAHDFNNHLAAILGNVELASMEMQDNGLTPERLGQAIKSVESARNLVKSLLAFSRKQTLLPVTVRLDKLVGETIDLLRRALGERVEIETDFEPDLWNICVDRNQLESALVNLAINARDSMEDGGTLRFECRNARRPTTRRTGDAGANNEEFVTLSVSDTGCGIPAEDLAKVFDPFFTTKDFGAGSGLGLSQVHGFVNQSGGDVEIDSTAGEGTTVTLHFPRSRDEEAEAGDRMPAGDVAAGKGQRILVIEDDAEVRAATIAMLERFGYEIVDGGEGDGVDDLCAPGEHCFDLILTDVVLPGGRNGPEIARRLTATYPNAKVLLMTGYAKEDIELADNAHLRYPILNKPFSARELAKNVRATLAA